MNQSSGTSHNESKKSKRIFVADDDPDLRDILRSILEAADFVVDEAPDGDSAFESIRKQPPDLLILDYMMPGLSGPEICERLKADVLLRYIPIIMLTGKTELQDKVHGISVGADDYVIKPFEPEELLARVEMVLRRTARDLDANPLTKLPGNFSIQRELEQRIRSKLPMAVCYIDLDQFKAFNDHYGFKRGDEAIQQTAAILLQASKGTGNSQNFVGHIGGDDFIVITGANKAEALCKEIVTRFDAMAPELYEEKDRARGYLLHTDRQGNTIRHSLLSISIAIVTTEKHEFTHPGEIAKIGAELKAYAKTFDRSLYVTERRKTL